MADQITATDPDELRRLATAAREQAITMSATNPDRAYRIALAEALEEAAAQIELLSDTERADLAAMMRSVRPN